MRDKRFVSSSIRYSDIRNILAYRASSIEIVIVSIICGIRDDYRVGKGLRVEGRESHSFCALCDACILGASNFVNGVRWTGKPRSLFSIS